MHDRVIKRKKEIALQKITAICDFERKPSRDFVLPAQHHGRIQELFRQLGSPLLPIVPAAAQTLDPPINLCSGVFSVRNNSEELLAGLLFHLRRSEQASGDHSRLPTTDSLILSLLSRSCGLVSTELTSGSLAFVFLWIVDAKESHTGCHLWS